MQTPVPSGRRSFALAVHAHVQLEHAHVRPPLRMSIDPLAVVCTNYSRFVTWLSVLNTTRRTKNMGIDRDDLPLTFPKAAEFMWHRYGVRPSVGTLYRWATRGVGGVRLESLRIGRRFRTTQGAIENFVTRRPVETPLPRQRSGPQAQPSTQGDPRCGKRSSHESVAVEIEKSRQRLKQCRSTSTKYRSPTPPRGELTQGEVK